MKYSADKAMKVPIFRLLWALYEDLLDERNSSSARDGSGTIISWYASIIEKRIANQLPHEEKE